MPMPRHSRLVAAAALAALAGGPARAAQDLPPPQAGGDRMPPVEVTIEAENDALRCEPGELRLPADSDVALRLANRSREQVTIAAPRIFENRNVLHHDGDVVHVASNNGYLVKAGGTGEIRLRTAAPGSYPFTCTGNNSQGTPFKGTLTLVAPNR